MQGLHHTQAHVVVVGGGPVGMLVAAELAAYGVEVVLFEPEARVADWPKATTLHARAVQSLARRGHLPTAAVAPAGAAGSGAFHFAGMPGLLIEAPETEPQPILKCPQAELERRFEERARAAGARILREHRVTEVVQEADGVRVTADGPRGTIACTAAYAVGADGARSTVRERTGIACDTQPATVASLMGTVTVTDPDSLAQGWLRTERGWIAAKRDAEGRMHIRTLDCAGAHADRQLPPTLEEVRREVSRIVGHDVAMEDGRWLSRFSDVSRLARTFRQGRVFLAGDAAHVHFPIGGQGLSTGVLDALNLSWKLALAVRGTAAPELLDTYDAERRPAAGRVVENTRAQLALMRPGPESDALRSVFTEVLAADGGRRLLGGMISAQDTVLPAGAGRPSPGAGTFLRNVALHTESGDTDVIGLLRDGRPLLLLLGERGAAFEDEARSWGQTLYVVRARRASDVPYDALLVRPDGYIAWTPGATGLSAALSGYVVDGAGAASGARTAVQPGRPANSSSSAALRASA
ncbi:FAD-dependent monooxygenase [Streptomyces sp. NPDC059072]|uniref:FAD-dependent monooxygenase n=1 Tax=Streptomyces sp. NPDC059072 TaxID=3346715 RepID=UPI0036ACEDA6